MYDLLNLRRVHSTLEDGPNRNVHRRRCGWYNTRWVQRWPPSLSGSGVNVDNQRSRKNCDDAGPTATRRSQIQGYNCNEAGPSPISNRNGGGATSNLQPHDAGPFTNCNEAGPSLISNRAEAGPKYKAPSANLTREHRHRSLSSTPMLTTAYGHESTYSSGLPVPLCRVGFDTSRPIVDLE